MRNGNTCISDILSFKSSKFWSTMRNENPDISFFLLSFFVLIYLWEWNIEKVDESNLHDWISYPTYEEWKLDSFEITVFFANSSYPTYEEWKLRTPPKEIPFFFFCSYPTYEEWKPGSRRLAHVDWSSLFLSYLWGMKPIPDDLPWFKNSSILPMRNGTFIISDWISFSRRSYPTYEEWNSKFL